MSGQKCTQSQRRFLLYIKSPDQYLALLGIFFFAQSAWVWMKSTAATVLFMEKFLIKKGELFDIH